MFVSPTLRAFPAAALAAFLVIPGGRIAAQDATTPAKVEIRGRVIDAQTGTPLHGAYVSLKFHEWGVLADESGRFVLKVDRSPAYVVVSENLGYAQLEIEILEEEPRELEVQLEPSPIQLDGIRVMADRFRSRRRAVSMSVRAFDRPDLLNSATQDVAEYLQTRVGRPIRECPVRFGFGSMCTFRRGRMMPVNVYIDEMPTFGGISELETYRPQELYLIEVYGGGSQIRIYTTRFMDRIIRSGRLLNPLPIG